MVLELIDVFDDQYNPLRIGAFSMDDVHSKGMWHQTFACWLINEERNSVIFQLRGPNNRVDPGSFDASASGHLSSGEMPEDGFRELEEELGVTIPNKDRCYLGVFRNICNKYKYINLEFCNVYLASHNFTLEDFVAQEGEVEGIFEADIDDAIALFTNQTHSIKVKSINGEREITKKDLCSYKIRTQATRYYLNVMNAAKAYFKVRAEVIAEQKIAKARPIKVNFAVGSDIEIPQTPYHIEPNHEIYEVA